MNNCNISWFESHTCSGSLFKDYRSRDTGFNVAGFGIHPPLGEKQTDERSPYNAEELSDAGKKCANVGHLGR